VQEIARQYLQGKGQKSTPAGKQVQRPQRQRTGQKIKTKKVLSG